MDLGSQGTLGIVVIGETIWMKLDGAYYASIGLGAAAPQLMGKYLKTTAHNKDVGRHGVHVRLSSFATSGIGPGDNFTNGPVVEGRRPAGADPEGQQGRLHVLVTMAAPHRAI
jgi:hypothetical protein